MTAKKYTKKRDAGAKFLFCYYKPIAFFAVLVAVAVVVAYKLPNWLSPKLLFN